MAAECWTEAGDNNPFTVSTIYTNVF